MCDFFLGRLRYSGKTLEASPWEGVSPIREILLEVEAAAGVGGGFFNCVLLNWYRDGTDYMGWHSGGLFAQTARRMSSGGVLSKK